MDDRSVVSDPNLTKPPDLAQSLYTGTIPKRPSGRSSADPPSVNDQQRADQQRADQLRADQQRADRQRAEQQRAEQQRAEMIEGDQIERRNREVRRELDRIAELKRVEKDSRNRGEEVLIDFSREASEQEMIDRDRRSGPPRSNSNTQSLVSILRAPTVSNRPNIASIQRYESQNELQPELPWYERYNVVRTPTGRPSSRLSLAALSRPTSLASRLQIQLQILHGDNWIMRLSLS